MFDILIKIYFNSYKYNFVFNIYIFLIINKNCFFRYNSKSMTLLKYNNNSQLFKNLDILNI